MKYLLLFFLFIICMDAPKNSLPPRKKLVSPPTLVSHPTFVRLRYKPAKNKDGIITNVIAKVVIIESGKGKLITIEERSYPVELTGESLIKTYDIIEKEMKPIFMKYKTNRSLSDKILYMIKGRRYE